MTKREKEEAQVSLTDAEAGAIQAVSEVERLKRVLTVIAEWKPETFPRVPDRNDPERTIPYGHAYGSNGERDFMRALARKTLGAIAPAGRVFTEAEVREAIRRTHEDHDTDDDRRALATLGRNLGLALD